ncbi:MAG TPA: hypothetical protein VJB11_02050 [archaeon]|nr:hypothetical protein [archaeon]
MNVYEVGAELPVAENNLSEGYRLLLSGKKADAIKSLDRALKIYDKLFEEGMKDAKSAYLFEKEIREGIEKAGALLNSMSLKKAA